ncbi:MAG: signal recognition particle receptor subunit alpha, partial [Porticoccaceae bacterium]|nr:signal recognition particle receptor subunit alpha [Porticoccaceae bacterium]
MSDDHRNDSTENNTRGGLFGRFRRSSSEPTRPSVEAVTEKPKSGFRERMRRALSRTGAGIGNLFLGRKSIDDDLLDELETLLLMADVGVEATSEIIATLT